MAKGISSGSPFDESIERYTQWCSHTEWFDYFDAAFETSNDKIVPTFLSVIGPKTFNLLLNILQPTKPGGKRKEIVTNPFPPNLWCLQKDSDFTDSTKKRESLSSCLWQLHAH